MRGSSVRFGTAAPAGEPGAAVVAVSLRGRNDLPALGQAVILRGLHVPLSLAAVLARAGVPGAVAGGLSLARVDARAHDLLALLRRGDARNTRREQPRD